MSITTLRLLVLPATLFLFAPSAPAQEEARDPETIPLQFNWAPGLDASVSTELRMLQMARPGISSDVRIVTRYRMLVEEHASGLLVRNTDGELLGIESDPPMAADDPMRLLYQGMSGIDRGYVVSDDGELLDVEGKGEVSAAFRTSLAPFFDSTANTPEMEGTLELLEGMLTPEALVSEANQLWRALISIWTGTDVKVGAVHQSETEELSPILPGITIPMRHETRLLERVPCPNDPETGGCVKLELRSFPDPTALQEMIGAITDQVGLQTLQLGFEEFEQENRVVLVARPESLIPYSMEVSATARAVTSVNGESMVIETLNTSKLTFDYESRQQPDG